VQTLEEADKSLICIDFHLCNEDKHAALSHKDTGSSYSGSFLALLLSQRRRNNNNNNNSRGIHYTCRLNSTSAYKASTKTTTQDRNSKNKQIQNTKQIKQEKYGREKLI
jgi:hypothetical protein